LLITMSRSLNGVYVFERLCNTNKIFWNILWRPYIHKMLESLYMANKSTLLPFL
jgi:hypothetical protein